MLYSVQRVHLKSVLPRKLGVGEIIHVSHFLKINQQDLSNGTWVIKIDRVVEKL